MVLAICDLFSLSPQFFWSIPIIFIAIRVFRPLVNAVKRVSAEYAWNSSAITIISLFGLLCYGDTDYIHERPKQCMYSYMMSMYILYSWWLFCDSRIMLARPDTAVQFQEDEQAYTVDFRLFVP